MSHIHVDIENVSFEYECGKTVLKDLNRKTKNKE